MTVRRFVPRLGQASISWLLEALLIVIGVALGMWVTQYQQARGDRELAGRVLQTVQTEIEHNRAVLEPYVTVHRAWLAALDKADTTAATRSGLDVFFATRPTLPPDAKSPFPFLRRSAWDTAIAGGTMRLIDLDVAAALSDIYRVQEVCGDNVNRLANGVLTQAATFDPASRVPAVRMLTLTLADIASAEASALDLYRQHLPAIRAAADAYR